MADGNLDMESVRISELDQTTEVDREKDYLVVSRHSDAYIDDEKSFKITPDDLLDGVGVNYNAGAHIAIDNNTHTISATYTNATTSADGLMSKEDKSTVDSLQPVATSGDYNDLTNKPTIPAAQVNSDWNSNSGVSEILNKPTLATVATTGDYNDLSNTPTIPAAQVNSDWNSNSGLSQILNKPQLSAVATSGNYSDLSNTPTIPEDLADLGDVDITSTSLSDNQVLKYDANSGKWINSTGGGGGGASDLNELDDVTITTPSENQVLKYNGTQWVNATSPAGATNLDGLTDVTIASPTPGQALVYNGTSGEWENTAVDYANIANKPTLATVATSGDYSDLSGTPTIPDELTDLTDIAITNPENDDVLKYDSTSNKWVNGQGGGGASALDDLTDVTITDPTVDQVLKFNGTSWVNGTGGDAEITKTASGSIATFETNLADELQSLKCEINASGGNGTPDNPNPINGYSSANITRCGVNLYPIKISNDTFADNASATHESSGDELVINASSSGNSGAYSTNASDIGKLVGMLSGEVTYSFDIYVTVAGWYLIGITNVGREAKNLSTGWQRITLTGTSNRTINTLVFYNQTNTASEIRVKNFILESGSSASDYEEYNGTSYLVSFGQTVYGGVYDKSGRLTITHTLLTLNGSENWSTRQSGVGTLYELNITEPIKAETESISNMYVWEMNLTANNTFRILASGSVKVIAIHDDNRTDLATFKSFLSNNNLTICVELATPIEIDVQAISVFAEKGTNNVFSDTGDTEVKYYTDLAGDIKELIEDTVKIDDLVNVDITTPSEGDTLVYDSNNSKWVNSAGGGGSAKQTAVTQAEYNALVQAGTVDPTMEYFITDGIPAQSKIPDAPTTDGTYHLSVTVTSGIPTYSWVSD